MTTTAEAQKPAAAVALDGPEPYYNRDGDELPEWTVAVIDEDGDPVGTVYTVRQGHAAALALARRMAADRRLELVDDSTPE